MRHRTGALSARLLALLLLAPAPAVAHAQGRSDPTEPREAFPRESSPTPGRTVAAAPRERVSVVAPDEGPDAFAIVSLLLLAAGMVATAVSLARDRVRYGGECGTSGGRRRRLARRRLSGPRRPG
jgi:hypothetical protein